MNQNSKKAMTKAYKVFELDVFFSSYGMEYALVGAVDEDDLKKHITKEFMNTLFGERMSKREFIKRLEEEKRIREIHNVFTDTPYVILARYCYWE